MDGPELAFTRSVGVPSFLARRVGCLLALAPPAFAVNERAARTNMEPLASRMGRAVFTTAKRL